MYIYKYIHVYIYKYTHKHTQTHTHTHTLTHTHTNTHTHTQFLGKLSELPDKLGDMSTMPHFLGGQVYSRSYPAQPGTSVGSKPEQNVFKMFWARVG